MIFIFSSSNVYVNVKLWYNLYMSVTIGGDCEWNLFILEVKTLIFIPTLHCGGRCEEAIEKSL